MTALPFFLAAPAGQRFCLFRPVAGTVRGAILYVHPFAEELNKSRRMAALQARAYAEAGYQVLQIDLYGCGDSSGDFGDARWQLWLDDLDAATHWLRQRCAGPLYLWGLRLGALLALDAARRLQPDGLILWQPVVSGTAHLHQFARLQSAARLFAAAAPGAATEIAGYTIAAPLAAAIMSREAASLAPPCPVQWLELTAGADHGAPALQPASALVVQGWREAGVAVHAVAVADAPFWHGSDSTEAPALLAASLAAMQQSASIPQPGGAA